jgi:hypothetical protein
MLKMQRQRRVDGYLLNLSDEFLSSNVTLGLYHRDGLLWGKWWCIYLSSSIGSFCILKESGEEKARKEWDDLVEVVSPTLSIEMHEDIVVKSWIKYLCDFEKRSSFQDWILKSNFDVYLNNYLHMFNDDFYFKLAIQHSAQGCMRILFKNSISSSSAITWAIQYGSTKQILLLWNICEQVTFESWRLQDGGTIFHFGACYGNHKNISMIVRKWSQHDLMTFLHVRNIAKLTALETATQVEVVKVLWPCCQEETTLISACKRGQLEIVRWLAKKTCAPEKSISIDFKDTWFGGSALDCAMMRISEQKVYNDIAVLLVKRGASINSDKLALLRKASESNRKTLVISLLVFHGPITFEEYANMQTWNCNEDIHEILSKLGPNAPIEENSTLFSQIWSDGKEHPFGLAIDGGGVRGIVPLLVLQALERALNDRIDNVFEIFAGTSAGGIIALSLAFGHSVQDTILMCFRLQMDIFQSHSAPYAPEQIHALLQSMPCKDLPLQGSELPRVFVTSTKVHLDGKRELYLFRSKKQQHHVRNMTFKIPGSYKYTCGQAMHATGCAPIYFKEGMSGNNAIFLDGGISPSCNCPAMVLHQYEGRDIQTILSLGTGDMPSILPGSLSMSIPADALQDPFAYAKSIGIGGAIQSVVENASAVWNVVKLLVDRLTDVDGVVHALQNEATHRNISFIRINPALSKNIDLNDSDDDVLFEMIFDVLCFLHQNRDGIIELTNHLKHQTE